MVGLEFVLKRSDWSMRTGPFPGLILMMMMLTVVMEMVIIMIANILCIYTVYPEYSFMD